MNCPSCSSSHLPYLRSPPRLPQASPSGPVAAGPKPSIAAQLRRHRRPSLPLLLTSTVLAFTLLLVAPATNPGCKLAQELGLLTLLLATELLRHCHGEAAAGPGSGAGAWCPGARVHRLVRQARRQGCGKSAQGSTRRRQANTARHTAMASAATSAAAARSSRAAGAASARRMPRWWPRSSAAVARLQA